VLRALGLSKKSWYYSQKRQSYEEKYIHLREPLLEIARDHPEYGYRRTAVELQEMGNYKKFLFGQAPNSSQFSPITTH
jgi:hypothetical protein